MDRLMSNFIKKIIYGISKIIWIFPINKRKVFFMSFNGTSYGYDSRAIVEYIHANENGEWKMIWGITNYSYFSDIKIDNLYFVKINSLRGMYHMMTSGTLFYNINPPSYLAFRKSQLLINSWHGFGNKKVGKYVKGFSPKQTNITTHYLSHAEKFTKWIIRESMEFTGMVLSCGAPRNDLFFSDKSAKINLKTRAHFNISPDSKIVLFAPTFRNNFEYEDCGIDFHILKESLEKRFHGEWIVMFRVHPMMERFYRIDNNQIIDVSSYPDMQDLLCMADVFVSDYSGGLWDFALQKKPAFVYANDVEEYSKLRGLYVSCEDLPYPVAKNNDELMDLILLFNYEEYQMNLAKYFSYMGCYEHGEACKTVLKLMYEWHFCSALKMP